MSDKKYSPREAALAVLAKAAEVAKKHEHIGWGKLHGKLEREGYSKESADKIAGAIKAKVHPMKKDLAAPEGATLMESEKVEKGEFEGHAKEQDIPPAEGDAHKPEDDHKDEDKDKQGTHPLDKHAADGDNAPMKGHIKLAKFMGRMEHKRGQKELDKGEKSAMSKPKLPS